MTAPSFPLPPFNEDPPGLTSANDRVIIRDYLNGKVLPALNQLAARVAALEAAPAPTPLPTPTPTPLPIPPIPPEPTTDAAKILALLGPTKSVTDTAALGPDFARYDQIFLEKLPSTNTWEDNYYDRSVVYYARYARSGDATFLQKGHDIVLKYRKDYLEPNAYKLQPNWSQVRGLELHYLLTGDAASQKAVAGIYAQGLAGFSRPIWGTPPIPDLANPQSSYMENRIQARCLQAALSCYRMGASYTGEYGEFTPATWPTELRNMLNQILSVQKADGSYSWVQICGGQLNYMVGMLNDVLIEYYRDFEADPRIPTAIQSANEYLWTTQWLAADAAFSYCSTLCAPNPFGTNVGGKEAAGDLNGLFIASFGWLYSRTGEQKWRDRGDLILSGLVSARWASNYSGSKNYNQAFSEAYRYFGWR